MCTLKIAHPLIIRGNIEAKYLNVDILIDEHLQSIVCIQFGLLYNVADKAVDKITCHVR